MCTYTEVRGKTFETEIETEYLLKALIYSPGRVHAVQGVVHLGAC